METLLSFIIFSIVSVVSFSYVKYHFSKVNRDIEKRRLRREKIALEKERTIQRKKEVEFFSKNPQSYKLLKAVTADGKSFAIDLKEEYNDIFIEYLHHFKRFAKIKGYSAHLEIEKATPNKILCSMDLEPFHSESTKVKPEEVFKSYLVSYPIFSV
ncbi:MAG: hypothetical protein OIF32_05175 [Campylobacterales bacterium]|nr:hypothetical protein [Campylobacterales bacterium]